MKYRLSFTIETEADPTTLLELIERQSLEFVDILDSEYDEASTVDEASPCVEGVQS
tara:strand:+ start:1168 stop:1335 length:168 start_codon:yes stop_codon:yes gene_type:complete